MLQCGYYNADTTMRILQCGYYNADNYYNADFLFGGDLNGGDFAYGPF
jgi:hypothetical protein